MINIPEDFNQFTHLFDWDAGAKLDDFADWADDTLSRMSDRQVAAIGRFVSDLLAQSPSDAQLQQIWEAGAPMLRISAGAWQEIFRDIEQCAAARMAR